MIESNKFYIYSSAVVACAMLLGSSGCANSSRTRAPSTALSPPDSQPTQDSTSLIVEEKGHSNVHSDPPEWLFASKVREPAEGGWARGSFDSDRNKIEIRTHGVVEFFIDTARLPIKWERLVVLGIDGKNSELKRRDWDVLRFRLNEHGQWVVVEP